MADIEYRLLSVEKDLETFRDIRLRALKDVPLAFTADYEESLAEPLEYFKRYFETGWIACAFMNDTPVGCVGLHRQPGKKVRHKGMIWGVYTAPEARGQGIARKLITMLLDQAEKAGLELVQLSTDETNPATLRLYASLGFMEYGREKHILKIGDHYVTDAMMVRFLR